MVFPKKEIVDRIKEEYPSGCRVKLRRMDDPYRNIPAGTKGTVKSVDDTGTIHVAWDTGNHLGIVYGEDECERLKPVTVICYGKQEEYDSKEEAVDFFQLAVAGSEGSEQQRYLHILAELELGKEICTDGVE